MRQLTAFASYFDNLGALLIGRARFYNMDGSPAEVFHRDSVGNYVTGGSVVFTNSSGQLEPQAFLDDHDYLVVFDKYIGGGTMAEDDDPESWEEQGSAVDQYNTLGVVLEGGATRSVNTIEDLRATAPIGTNEVVLLLGYNSAGDVEPIYYRWSQSTTGQDNGGSKIKVVDPEEIAQGRWVFVDCPEYLDVRHFGAFPLETIEEDAVQRASIQNAYNYAHGIGRGIYFPATSTANYFDISGLTLIGVDSHPNARVFCGSEQVASVSDIKTVHCASAEDYDGLITLAGETVRTSWGGASEDVIFNPSSKLILDSEIAASNKSWEDIQVEILEYTAGCVFDGCLITSNGKIDDTVSIIGCEIKESWFEEGYNWGHLISYQNQVDLKNFKNANSYVVVKNKQNEADYGDLEGKTISNIVLLADCILENAVFSTVALQGSSSLKNISGTIVLQGANVSHNWVDCWLEVTAFAGSISSFSLLRGSFKSSLTITISGDASFDDVKIESLIFVRGKLTMYDCKISEDMQAYDLLMSNCDVMAAVGIFWYNGYLKGSIQCNKFLSGGYLAVNPGVYSSGSIDCEISITGNYSDHDFWDDSAFDGVSHTTSGKIVYEGNYGGCPGNRASYRSALTFEIKVPDILWGVITSSALNQDDNSIWMVDDYRHQDNAIPERQFWWSIKINRTHNFDDLKIWRCKYLNYNRKVNVKGLFTADFTATNGEIVSFSFNPYTFQRLVGPAPLDEKVQQETLAFQQVASSYYGPNNSDTYPSRLASLVSGASQLNGSQLWEYEVF